MGIWWLERGRDAEMNWNLVRFYRHGNSLSNRLFTLTMAKTRWVSEAGAVCSAIGSKLFPEEIILLTTPLRIHVTKIVMKNTRYRNFSFQLLKPNFKYNEVMLAIKLQIWKLCLFRKLWSKYRKYNNVSGQKAMKRKYLLVWTCGFGYCF